MSKASVTTISYKDGLLDAANMLSVTDDQIRLAGGEFTAQELRTVRAILQWRQRAMRELANGR